MDKSSSSPSPTRLAATPQATSSDENDLSYQRKGSNWRSPNKLKKFSSPANSSGSKAIAPRKKILSERNETSETNFSDTYTEKPQTFDPKASFSNRIGIGSDVSGFDDEQNAFVPDSSSQPYDPLTNYLSPRPKFLRYQPNRRRQILLSLKNEKSLGKDGLDSGGSLSLDSQVAVGEEASSVSSSQCESSLKQDDEEIDEETVEGEDEEEEEEEKEEEERSNWGLRGVLKSFLLFVVLVLCTSYTSSMNSQTPALQAVWDVKDGYERVQHMIVEAVKNLEGSGSPLDDGFEVEEMVSEATMIIEDDEKSAYNLDDGFEVEEMVVDIGDSELLFSEASMVVEDDKKRSYNSADLLEEELDSVVDEDKRAVYSSDNVVKEEELQGIEEENVAENELHNDGNLASVDVKDVSGTEVEVVKKQGVAAQIKERTFHPEPSILIGAAIGFITIVVFLVMGSLHFKRKRRAEATKDGSLVNKHSSEPVTVPKCSSVVEAPMEEENEEEPIAQLGCSRSVSQAIYSTKEEDLTENQSKAPRIQMLSEFVVSTSSVSVRSCGTKTREEAKKTTSTSMKYSDSVPIRSRPENNSSLSSSESQCNGSFKTEKKVVKKKIGGGDGKENEEVVAVTTTTPVRRSSRIRSRSITSP